MSKLQFLRMWSAGVGAMDALTGLQLIFLPGMVLGLLGIATPSADALVFLSWIGVFVMAVGLSYLMAFGSSEHGEAVWRFTALVRLLVAVFLVVQIINGSLVFRWALVAAADGFVALVQIAILRKQWWRTIPE